MKKLLEQVDGYSETSRAPGYMHVVPLACCPLCQCEPDIVEYDMVYTAECQNCGLVLGLPYGYASRLYLAADWNRRATTSTLEKSFT